MEEGRKKKEGKKGRNERRAEPGRKDRTKEGIVNNGGKKRN